ncbi:hypothetical protein QAD02_024115 [Eretmocerus hayati]|uniref:Uncharacterized protein n=1 Tax=Eretmocerus hayati TaxID=131215 RepID=A0ACC2Q2N2_9HYME|nr:hypothetical protein QAD02_024115 [Eretmocerus hayati]
MSKPDGPKFVIALYSFKGKNNDELCFKKGDIIAITQVDDGGWWEGTLYEKTGWFPANYTKEFKPPDSASTSSKVWPGKFPVDSSSQHTLNRDIVLKDIVDSERANVAELQGLVSNFLEPLGTANILEKDEFKQLTGNFFEVLDAHQQLLANLDSVLSQGSEARVGNIFLSSAPKLKSIHVAYCTFHPQAVCILDCYRDELNNFMEKMGAITPGILVLTTGLSKPFRRLEKYSTMLQELERHTEYNHPDRGDTQRSVSVYRDIADRCAAIRKQRELALQILTSGIKGYEGEDLSQLGDIIHVGPVIVSSGSDRKDRYFVLFSSTLLVLSASPRMSSFVYEGRLPITGISIAIVEPTEDMRYSFEISGPMIESMQVICSTRDERHHWVELLSQEQIASRVQLQQQPQPGPSTSRQSLSGGSSSGSSPSSATVASLGASAASSTGTATQSRSPSSSVSHSSSQNLRLLTAGQEKSSPLGTRTQWTPAVFRPSPPIYSLKNFGRLENLDSSRATKNDEQKFEDDAVILKVIEGYCTSTNARFTMHSAMLMDFDPLRVNNRASFVNSKVENWDICENRGLSETVKALKNQMVDLQLQVAHLCKQVEDERKSRLSLTAAFKKSIAIADGSVP